MKSIRVQLDNRTLVIVDSCLKGLPNDVTKSNFLYSLPRLEAHVLEDKYRQALEAEVAK